jgi:hypothetical protein
VARAGVAPNQARPHVFDLLGAVLDEADHEARPLSASSSSVASASVGSSGAVLHLRRAEPLTNRTPRVLPLNAAFHGEVCASSQGRFDLLMWEMDNLQPIKDSKSI